MRSALLGRIWGFCFRALLVFLAWTAIDQGSTLGDCRSHDAPVIPLDFGPGIGLDRVDRAEIPTSPKPCTGPTCSGRPTMPIAPATPDVQRIASWAILQVTDSFLTADPSSEPLLDEELATPSDSSASIFHPPRLSPTHVIS